jgi:hypothetical protein
MRQDGVDRRLVTLSQTPANVWPERHPVLLQDSENEGSSLEPLRPHTVDTVLAPWSYLENVRDLGPVAYWSMHTGVLDPLTHHP